MKRVWTPKWPAGCRECGTKTRAHLGQGYCTRCYGRERTAESLVRTRHAALIRTRDGCVQHFCFTCRSWKNEPEFRRRGNWFRTRCHACTKAAKKEWYQRERERLNAERRERNAKVTAAIREADRRRAQRNPDPWSPNRGILPLEAVQRWIDVAYAMHAGDPDSPPSGWGRVALVTGLSERMLWRVRNGESATVSVDVAEMVARSIDAIDEFRELTKPGFEGWSKHSDYCLRCGRYDLPHHALGLCRRCYSSTRWHRRQGRPHPPLPKEERWATWHNSCVLCGRTEYKHQGHGVCASCYHKARKRRSQ